VPGKNGPVMLGNVARLSIDGGPAEIDRYDACATSTSRSTERPAARRSGTAGAGAASLQNLPPGVIQTTVGDAER